MAWSAAADVITDALRVDLAAPLSHQQQGAAIAASAAFFSLLFLAHHRFWVLVCRRTCGKGASAELLAAATCAFVHGCAITAWSWRLVSPLPWWDALDSANTREQELAVCFSAGYFVADTVAYLLPHAPQDVHYIVHHVATFVFLAAALHARTCAVAMLFGVFLGEVTNPFFHVYNVLEQLAAGGHAWAARAFRPWSLLFTAVFLLVRTVGGVPTAVWWCRRMAGAAAPAAHRAVWIVSCIGITGVSQAFSVVFVRAAAQQWRAGPAGTPAPHDTLRDLPSEELPGGEWVLDANAEMHRVAPRARRAAAKKKA